MAKRLETSKEFLHLQKESASPEAQGIIDQINQFQENLDQYPQGSNERQYVQNQIGYLKQRLRALVEQGTADLTYQDLSYNSELMRNIGLPQKEFAIPKSEQITFPKQKDVAGLPEEEQDVAFSEAEVARGDVTQYAEEQMSEALRQKRLEQERTRGLGEERIRRDLIENPIWQNLSDKTESLGKNGRPGSLTDTEASVIMRLLRSAPESIESPERFDEFMQDLFNIVETNRDPKNFKYAGFGKTASEIPQEIRQYLQNLQSELGPEILSFDLRPESERPKLGPAMRGKKDPVTIGSQEFDFWKRVNLVQEGNEIFAQVTTAPGQTSRTPLQELIEFRKRHIDETANQVKPQIGLAPKPEKWTEAWKAGDPEPWGGISESEFTSGLGQSLAEGIRNLLATKYRDVKIEPTAELVARPGEPDTRGISDGAKSIFFGENYDTEGLYPGEKKELESEMKGVRSLNDILESLSTLGQADVSSRILKELTPAIEETTGQKLKMRREREQPRDVRDEQDLDPVVYQAFRQKTDAADFLISRISDSELASPDNANKPFGYPVYENGYPIEELKTNKNFKNIVPELMDYLVEKHGLSGPEEITQDQMPTNIEMQDLLDTVLRQIMDVEFMAPGGRAEQYTQQDRYSSELVLARKFADSGYQKQSVGTARGTELESIKDESETIQGLGEYDPAYYQDLSSWISTVDSSKVRSNPNSQGLTENQRANAATWYTYDWWFKNVYMGPEETIRERIKRVKESPMKVTGEAEGRYEENLERAAKKERVPTLEDFNDYSSETVVEALKQEFPDLSQDRISGLLKQYKKAYLLQKVADFMAHDPETSEWLRTKSPPWRDAMGQFVRNPMGIESERSIPDVGNVIWAYIARNFQRNNGIGYPQLDRLVYNLMRDDAAPAEAIRAYIRMVSRYAILDEMKKQWNLNRTLRKRTLPGFGEIEQNLFDLYETLDNDTAADDPDTVTITAEALKTLGEQVSEIEDPLVAMEESLDDALIKIMQNPFLADKSNLSKFMSKLPSERDKKLWSFLYGSASNQDVWKSEEGSKPVLNRPLALRLWNSTYPDDRIVSEDALVKRKQRLNTVASAILRNNEEFADLYKAFVDFSDEDMAAKQMMADSTQRVVNRNKPMPDPSMEEAPAAVNEPAQTQQRDRIQELRERGKEL